jgi:hypothetical protein
MSAGELVRRSCSSLREVGSISLMRVIPYALRRSVIALVMGVMIVGWANDPAMATRNSGYDTRLSAGTYRIGTPPFADGRLTKDLPKTVTITEGRTMRLDIRIDTGIR